MAEHETFSAEERERWHAEAEQAAERDAFERRVLDRCDWAIKTYRRLSSFCLCLGVAGSIARLAGLDGDGLIIATAIAYALGALCAAVGWHAAHVGEQIVTRQMERSWGAHGSRPAVRH